jgi:hypothetical protein
MQGDGTTALCAKINATTFTAISSEYLNGQRIQWRWMDRYEHSLPPFPLEFNSLRRANF